MGLNLLKELQRLLLIPRRLLWLMPYIATYGLFSFVKVSNHLELSAASACLATSSKHCFSYSLIHNKQIPEYPYINSQTIHLSDKFDTSNSLTVIIAAVVSSAEIDHILVWKNDITDVKMLRRIQNMNHYTNVDKRAAAVTLDAKSNTLANTLYSNLWNIVSNL
ncbi:hypothetical protein BB560_004354 [Smittium megazygosporum]|uniref:Uncharacterized protein n=1 Tax=Smittium megazygosporum TaxID=133381 RepID=A0A2T9Z9F7_9FUNG|nr:hypothetical protein BB560_004354 [Smittium megazygosporum]